VTEKDLVFLLFTGKWEAYPEGGARINGIDKCATSAPPWASHATQKSPAPAQVPDLSISRHFSEENAKTELLNVFRAKYGQ
jgi:hypothetical protein